MVDDHPDRHDRARPAVESGPRQAPRRAARTGRTARATGRGRAGRARGTGPSATRWRTGRGRSRVGRCRSALALPPGTGPNRSTAQEIRVAKGPSRIGRRGDGSRTDQGGGGRRPASIGGGPPRGAGGRWRGSRFASTHHLGRETCGTADGKVPLGGSGATLPLPRTRVTQLTRPHDRQPASRCMPRGRGPSSTRYLRREAWSLKNVPTVAFTSRSSYRTPSSNSRRSVRGRCVASTPSSVPRSGARRGRSTEHRLLVLGCRAERRPASRGGPTCSAAHRRVSISSRNVRRSGCRPAIPAFASRVRCRRTRQGQVERLGEGRGRGLARGQGAGDGADPDREARRMSFGCSVMSVSVPTMMRCSSPMPAAHPRSVDRHRGPPRLRRGPPPAPRRPDRGGAGARAREPLWLGRKPSISSLAARGVSPPGSRERMPFEHSVHTAAGVLVHKAIEVDVGSATGWNRMRSPSPRPTGWPSGKSGSPSTGGDAAPSRTSC